MTPALCGFTKVGNARSLAQQILLSLSVADYVHPILVESAMKRAFQQDNAWDKTTTVHICLLIKRLLN